MESKVLGKYRIMYPEYKVSQTKNLISHDDYDNLYKPMSSQAREFESEAAELNKKKHADKIADLKKEAKRIKAELSEMFGSEFFTDKSPIWLSKENNGVMTLLEWQGGNIRVELEKVA